jgi:hypothetical protein
MTEDLVVFLFGCLVTTLCIAAVAILLWGATHDEEAKSPRTEARE